MSGDTPDFNIDNYGIDELLDIFGITSPLKKEAIMKIAAGFIEKYQKLKQTAYVEFFSKAMNKLVSNYNLVEGILGKVDGILDDINDNKEYIQDFIEENGEELMEEANNLYEKGLDFIEDAKEHVDEFLNPQVEQAGPNVLKNRYYNAQTGPERVGQHVMPNRGNYISVPTEGVSSHAPQLQQRLMLPNAFAQIPFAQGYRNPTLQNVYISWINVDSQYREIKARTVNTAQCDETEQESFNNNNSNLYLQNDNSTDFLFTLQQPMTNVMAMTVGSIEVPLAGYYAFSNSYGNTTFELLITGLGIEIPIQCLRIPEGNYDISGITQIINTELKTVFDILNSGSTLITNNTYPTMFINESNQKTYFAFYPNNPEFTVPDLKFSIQWYNRDRCGCCENCINNFCDINNNISESQKQSSSPPLLVKPEGIFNQCLKKNTGKKINSTLGWSLGFREQITDFQYINKRLNIVADLSLNEIKDKNNNPTNKFYGAFSQGVWNELGTKYMILEIDDFNHNRNSGVMGTMTMPTSTNKFKLPKYAQELSQVYPSCDISGTNVVGLPPDLLDSSKNSVLTSNKYYYENFKRAYRKGTAANTYGIRGQDTLTTAQKYTMNEIRGAQRRRNVEQYYAPQSTDILFRFPVQRLSTNLQAPLIIPNAAGMDNGRRYFGPVTIEKLKVRLLDDKGYPINLNGGDISFSLIFERLYQY
jgi:hypothetical protein